MKVQLINPPVGENIARCTRAGCFPPYDLVTLASYLNTHRPDIEIEILDGELLSLPEILDSLAADLVGLSPKLFSYESALTIAQAASDAGARVVLGGAYASSLPDRILRHRPTVDVVVAGQGEHTLLGLVNGQPYHELPNLVYRDAGVVRATDNIVIPLDDLPPADFSLLKLAPYHDSYRSHFASHQFQRPLICYSHRGCDWYDRTGGCVFCRLQDRPSQRMSPARFWTDASRLVADHNCDLLWDVSDTFTSPIGWLRELVASKPRTFATPFYLYARVADLNDEVASLLCRLGCFEVLIGAESGDDDLLRRCNKGMTAAQTVAAVRRCAQYDVEVFPTLLLGLPGETQLSLQKTVALAAELVGVGNIREVSCALLVPLPGSPVFEQLSKALRGPAWLTEGDVFDMERLQQAYLNTFTHVSLDELRHARAQIDSLVEPRFRSSFGVLSHGTATQS